MKQIVLFVGVILAILMAFVVAWQLFSIVLLFVASLVIAATFRLPIERLIERGLRRSLAMLLVYGLAITLILGLLALIGLALVEELTLLVTDINTVYARLQSGWLDGQRLGPLLATRMPPPEQVGMWLADGYMAQLLQVALGMTQSFLGLTGQVLLALVLSVYWTADRLRFERLWLSLLPSDERIRARQIWRALEDGVGAYTRSELVQTILAGGLLTLGYWLIDLQYPFLWALIAAFSWLIPFLGGVMALIPLVLVTWIVMTPVTALLATAITIAVFVLMEVIVEPLFYRYDRLQKILVLLVMIALVDAYGILGLLIAPFLATAIKIFLQELFTLIANPTLPIELSESLQNDLSSLQERMDAVREMIPPADAETEAETPMVKSLRSMANRLSKLLEETTTLHHPNPSKRD